MDIFWKVVKNLNWDGNYRRCAKYLTENYSLEDIKKLENITDNLMSDLYDRFEDDWLQRIPVGDDAWSDLRAEVIGRGKEFFENITTEKLIEMAENSDYKESFLYIFNYDKPKPSYPEHEKMKAVSHESQIIGDFLENCGYELCSIQDEHFMPTHKSTEKILAEYFNIDLNKIEQEKLQMIEALKN